MADGARPALGLSIGATNLAAVTADHAITRKPVVTLYRQRPPEVGVPSENPRLDEPGLVIGDFVDRVGDQIGIVATDGSMHRSEALVADALRALAYAATGGRALPASVAVTYPAHWSNAAIDALGASLSRVSEWSNRANPLSLLPDAAAALAAVRENPGIPARGIVAVCDFGGSGTSITVVDADGDYQPLAPTVRHHDFSGDSIDQSLLTYVMSEMPHTGPFDPSGTAAIGSLTKLRIACRNAKERLSSTSVTTLAEDVPGTSGDIRITRNELEETIRGSLDSMVRALEKLLGRSGIQPSRLVAIASVGGGAHIPSVTTTLSGRFGVPVITTPRPQLTAAIGGALRAARGPADSSATVLTPAAAALAPSVLKPADDSYLNLNADAPVSAMQPALAWSETADDSRAIPAGADDYRGAGSGLTGARPQLAFERDARPKTKSKAAPLPWYRLPAVLITATAVAIVLVGVAVAMALNSGGKPANQSPGSTTAPRTTASSVAPSTTPEPAPAPAPESPIQPPPAAPPTEAPAPQTTARTTEAPPPAPTRTSEPVSPSSTQSSTQPPVQPPTQPPTTQPPPSGPPPGPPQTPTQPPIPQVPNSPQLPQIPQVPQVPPVPQLPGVVLRPPTG